MLTSCGGALNAARREAAQAPGRDSCREHSTATTLAGAAFDRARSSQRTAQKDMNGKSKMNLIRFNGLRMVHAWTASRGHRFHPFERCSNDASIPATRHPARGSPSGAARG
jgi:hypothetical protein